MERAFLYMERGGGHGCYKETRWLGMHKPAGTTAGNHQRHTHTINVSPPTKVNKATRASNGNPAARLLHTHLTNTPHTHHTAPCDTEATATDTAARHPLRARQGPVVGAVLPLSLCNNGAASSPPSNMLQNVLELFATVRIYAIVYAC